MIQNVLRNKYKYALFSLCFLIKTPADVIICPKRQVRRTKRDCNFDPISYGLCSKKTQHFFVKKRIPRYYPAGWVSQLVRALRYYHAGWV